ncbi:MAG: hypothetical protein GXO75_09970 [Calditrichaeota bacterium]|nr:hypothetical protein [Calditrichota bacterium]
MAPARIIYLAILLFIFWIILSCFNPFAPKIDRTNDDGFVLTEQRTPEDVLTNFIYAYTFKDSIVYANLLDSSFVFVFFDPNFESSGRFVSWGRDVDLKTTGQLFRNFETITLTWNTTIYYDTSKTNEAELSKTFQLNLFGKAGDYSLSGNAIFNMIKNDFDSKWRIKRWKDESQL